MRNIQNFQASGLREKGYICLVNIELLFFQELRLNSTVQTAKLTNSTLACPYPRWQIFHTRLDNLVFTFCSFSKRVPPSLSFILIHTP